LTAHPPGFRVADLNIQLIEWLRQKLGLQCSTTSASSLGQQGKRSELLANICQATKAKTYISALGAASYLLKELREFSDHEIDVTFQHYEHPEYRQLFPPFCPYASTLDLLFNEGERSLKILRSGRRAPFLPEEAMHVTSNLAGAS